MPPVFIDTSIAVDLLRNRIAHSDIPVADEGWYLSVVAAGELYFGAAKAQSSVKNLAALTSFLGTIALVPVTHATATVYGQLRGDLALRGALIPDNDIWIAASAVEHGLSLVSSDRHFERISSLNHRLVTAP